jgi:hypothetical protein
MRGRRGASAGLARYLPAVEWLAGYQGPWLRGDQRPRRVAGVLLLAAGVLRLGFAADFSSAPVLAASRRASGC